MIYDNYPHGYTDMYGTKKYQLNSQTLLPILINHAVQAKKNKIYIPISYSDCVHNINKALETEYYNEKINNSQLEEQKIKGVQLAYSHIGHNVLPCITTTLYKWEQAKNIKLPRLSNIVMSEISFKKYNFVYEKLKIALNQIPLWEDYETKLLRPIIDCDIWTHVLDSIETVRDVWKHDLTRISF